jgi:predicted porin
MNNNNRRARRWLAAPVLGLAALGAHAQSNVSVYGLIDVSAGATKNPGGASVTGVDSGKLTTSNIGFGGSEDLGGGLSAQFKLEAFFRADTGETGRFNGDPMFARTASVGLSHKQWGTINLGRTTTQLFVATLSFNALGDSFGYSPSIRHYFGGGQGVTTGDTGWNDSIAYSSPVISGFRFGATVTSKESAAGVGNGGNWSAGLSYSGGPLAATVVYQSVKKDGAAAVQDTETTQVGASYDAGVARGFLQVGRVKNLTTGNRFDLTGLGVRVPVGKGAAVAQFGRLDPRVGAERNTLSVGYLYNFSRRTEGYVVVMNDKVDGLSSGGGYSVGIRHRF